MTRTKGMALVIALALTAACGGDDDDDGRSGDDAADADTAEQADDADPPAGTTPAATSDDSNGGDTDDAAAAPAGGSDVAVPIARFTAHGPQAETTIGPACAMGIDTRGGDVFRFTPPAGFTWGGTSGGSGSDQVEIRADDVSLYVTESAYDYDTAILNGWDVVGPAGVDVEIDGVALPVMEITLEGDPGYALVDVDYLSPMPMLTAGAALGTVAVTSREPGRPTLDEATELLASVRIERCAAVGESMIWGPARGVHLVPQFEPDPLGKSYPAGDQPVYEPGVSQLDSYSLEQIGYLMPVEGNIAMCAAERAREFGAGNPIGFLTMFTPSGTFQEEFETVIAGC